MFLKEEMSSMEIFRIEEEVRKNEEEITKNIKVKGEVGPQLPWYILFASRSYQSLSEVTTDAEAG